MSIPAKYLATLEAEQYYHVYNRTTNKEVLFRNDENYAHFLKLYNRYLCPFCKTHSWCLIPNHFHLLLEVRPIEVLYQHFREHEMGDRMAQRIVNNENPAAHEIVSNAFKRLFTSYAMTYNLAFERSGNLFHRPFKRLLVQDETQLLNTAVYIHTNPKHHGITDAYQNYAWSSYNSIIEQCQEPEPAYLLNLFGGIHNYVATHMDRAERLAYGDIEDYYRQ